MTFAEAQAAARLPLKKRRLGKLKGKASAGRLEAYRCHFCDGYHYGHPIRRKT